VSERTVRCGSVAERELRVLAHLLRRPWRHEHHRGGHFVDPVELGLVYDVAIDGGKVDITFTLTTPACPIGPQVSEQMVEFVGEIDGVEQVVPTMVFTPPWTPDKMSEDAKFALGY